MLAWVRTSVPLPHRSQVVFGPLPASREASEVTGELRSCLKVKGYLASSHTTQAQLRVSQSAGLWGWACCGGHQHVRAPQGGCEVGGGGRMSGTLVMACGLDWLESRERLAQSLLTTLCHVICGADVTDPAPLQAPPLPGWHSPPIAWSMCSSLLLSFTGCHSV